jgi:GT2 family glycosyltransferase
MGRAKKTVKAILRAGYNPKRAAGEAKMTAKRYVLNRKRRAEYIVWFDEQRLSDVQLADQREDAKKLKHQPLISVLLPTYNTKPHHLRECIDSVIAQTYTNWEICISDDASPSEETKAVIREYVEKYDNIKATFNKKNGHIAASSNVALGMAKGEFTSLLDHDDLLAPNALFETVKKINEFPDADLIYTDEDKLEDDSIHMEPFFKPDWSPDFLHCCNYITHFATLRTKIMKEVGGFTQGTQGAQDWDLFLKVSAVTEKIYHVPKILYSWRKSETSTASSPDSKPYAYINQGKTLRHSLASRKINGSVEAQAALGFWRVRYGIEGTPLVSIIIPTINSYEYIKKCVDSIIEKTTYPHIEVVIVDTGSTDKNVENYYTDLELNNPEIKVVRWDKKPFNFSDACNFGVENSKGEYLLFLNNDTKVVSPDWVEGMLQYAQRKDVGMVGVRLHFPNDRIQHAGVVLSAEHVAFHPLYNQNILDYLSSNYTLNARNISAVTAACSMVSRKKFDQVGGFDTKLRVTYNDVDLCLKLMDAGYRNVYNPFVILYHYESISVGKINTGERDHTEFEEAKALMKKRWSKYLEHDPYYNANFEQRDPGYHLPVKLARK